MFSNPNLYIPFREARNAEKFLPGIRKICELAGTSFPRHIFPADQLPQELALNLERIEKIRQADLPANLRDSKNLLGPEELRQAAIGVLKGIHETMQRVGRLYQLGFSKRRILKELRKLGSID